MFVLTKTRTKKSEAFSAHCDLPVNIETVILGFNKQKWRLRSIAKQTFKDVCEIYKNTSDGEGMIIHEDTTAPKEETPEVWTLYNPETHFLFSLKIEPVGEII